MAILITRDGTELKGAGNVTNLSAEGKRITNLAAPSSAGDAATKAYVDGTAGEASAANDSIFNIFNDADNTKQIAFDASDISPSTIRTISMPDANVNLALVNSAVQSNQLGAAGGVATLNASGKLSAGQVPAIAITETFVVATIAARDALVVGPDDGEVQEGDVAIVTDASGDVSVDAGGASYIYDGSAWQRLLNPNDAVQSVNGLTGVVVLDTDDVAEGASNLYYTQARFDTAFSGKSTSDLSEGSNLYFTTARVLSTALAGLSLADDSAVEAADTLLEAIGKLQARSKLNNMTAIVAPTAVNDSSEGYEEGSLWYDSVENKLYVNEDATVEAAAWQQVSGAVDSVNGETGAVVLDSDDIDEGTTNLYFTDARAQSAAVADEIVDAVTDVAPSQNAVFDALALKADESDLAIAEGDIDALQADSGRVFDAGVAGESFAINEVYLVRRANSSETAGRYYKAQADSFANSRVVGYVVVGATAVSAADPIRVYKFGEQALGSADSLFGGANVNSPVYLDQSTAGKFTLAPATTSGSIIKPVGYVAEDGTLEFQPDTAIQA